MSEQGNKPGTPPTTTNVKRGVVIGNSTDKGNKGSKGGSGKGK